MVAVSSAIPRCFCNDRYAMRQEGLYIFQHGIKSLSCWLLICTEINRMPYIYPLPSSISFTGKGLSRYTYGPLTQKDVEVYYVEVKKGHDVFMISKKIMRTYYIVSGNGYFMI